MDGSAEDTRDRVPCLIWADTSTLGRVDLGELGAVLRLHRGRIQPADVGLVHGPRRSVSGLRRSEVARLAGASTGYYAALERGVGGRPSAMVLAALARALRLDDDDYARCRALAARPDPAPGSATSHVPPGLLHLLDLLVDLPAQVTTGSDVVLVQNRIASVLFGGPGHVPPVGCRSTERIHVAHPSVGTVALKRRTVLVEGFAQRLHWYTPIPGTDAGDKLGLLAVLGLQDLDDGT